MKLGFGPKYFLMCILTDSVNNSILKKISFGLNGPDRVTNFVLDKITCKKVRNSLTILLHVAPPFRFCLFGHAQRMI